MARLKRFQIKTYLAACELSVVVADVMNSPNPAEVFKEYMMAVYSQIKTTAILFQAGADEAERRFKNGDASCAGLAEYILKHKKEEVEHAEWLLADLISIGVSADEIVNRRPLVDIAALVGSQYYWIYHYHPALLLGYFAIFEGFPMGHQQIDGWRARTGFPDSAFRTIRVHAELDPYHSAELNEIFEHCALSDEVFDALSVSMIASCSHFASALRSVAKVAQERAARIAGPAPTENAPG